MRTLDDNIVEREQGERRGGGWVVGRVGVSTVEKPVFERKELGLRVRAIVFQPSSKDRGKEQMVGCTKGEMKTRDRETERIGLTRNQEKPRRRRRRWKMKNEE
jgi:hypothetical protein